MNDKRENVVYIHSEQKTASVTHSDTHNLTVGQRVRKVCFSTMNVILFMTRQIAAAIFSLMMPIFYFIIGSGVIFSYILFGISAIALFVADDISKPLEMMVGSVVLFLLCKIFINLVVNIKYKIS